VSKDDTIVIGSLNTLGVHDTASRGSQELNTRLPYPVNVVREGEEGVGRTSDTLELVHVSLLFLLGKRSRDFVEQAVPLRLLTGVGLESLSSDEEIDSVGLVSTLGSLLERKSEHTRVVTQPPVVSLLSGQSGTVNSGLLTSTETNDGTVQSVTDRVGLSVLQSKGSDGQVGDSLLGELFDKGRVRRKR
jgi:DNA helicase HerA-like ATPase